MTFFVTGAKIECDNCRTASRELDNQGKLPLYALENKLEAEGWIVGWGGNICLCLKCKTEAEARYKLSLEKKKIKITTKAIKPSPRGIKEGAEI